MEHDEHEMLIEYSEMTAFDFQSKEYQEVIKDYMKCKSFISNIAWMAERFINKLKPAKNY